MEDGNSWISFFNVMVVRCEPPTEHCVVSEVYKELNYSGHDWCKGGMMQAIPHNGQRKLRYFFDSWTPCLNLKRWWCRGNMV